MLEQWMKVWLIAVGVEQSIYLLSVRCWPLAILPIKLQRHVDGGLGPVTHGSQNCRSTVFRLKTRHHLQCVPKLSCPHVWCHPGLFTSWGVNTKLVFVYIGLTLNWLTLTLNLFRPSVQIFQKCWSAKTQDRMASGAREQRATSSGRYPWEVWDCLSDWFVRARSRYFQRIGVPGVKSSDAKNFEDNWGVVLFHQSHPFTWSIKTQFLSRVAEHQTHSSCFCSGPSAQWCSSTDWDFFLFGERYVSLCRQFLPWVVSSVFQILCPRRPAL